MPSKNTVKKFEPDQYYHVYNRGVEKRIIFVDSEDYIVFLGLIKKYLTGERVSHTDNRHKFKHLGEEIELLSYCLMPNHFHLLLYQHTNTAITVFMRKLATGYSMYFNRKYDRVGGLFQGIYKASLITSDPYLTHISRYIHLNPQEYREYSYSSLRYYLRPDTAPIWVMPSRILEIFDDSPEKYGEFIDDYVLSNTEAVSVLKLLADYDDVTG